MGTRTSSAFPRRVVMLVLAAAAILPYAGGLDGELVWDDRILITEELRFHSPDFPLRVFAEDFFHDIEEIYRYGYYRPLVSLSYYLTWVRAGDAPRPYHLCNLILHASTTVLVFLVLLQLLAGRPWAAATGALLFAVHPVHAESVAWISGRTDVVCALFLLLSTLTLLRLHPIDGTSSNPPPRRSWALMATSAAAFGLSLFAKEMALFWPGVLAAFAATRPPGHRRWWLRAAVLYAAAAIPYFVLRLAVAGTIAPPMQWRVDQLPAVALSFASTLARYMGKLLLPFTAEPYIQNPLVESLLSVRVVCGMMLLAAAAVLAWRCRHSQPGVTLLALFSLLSFGPISNLIRIAGPRDMGAPMAERFLYIPTIGLFGLAGWAISELAGRIWWRAGRHVATVLVLAACVAFGLAAADVTAMWQSERTLYQTMVRQAPDAALPNLLLGTVHCRDGQWSAGIANLRRAESLLQPDHSMVRIAVKSNLAGALTAVGQVDDARSLLLEVRDPSQPISHLEFNLGLSFWIAGRHDEALTAFDSALGVNPWHPQTLLKRARLKVARGELEEAEEDVDRFAGRYGHSAESMLILAMVRGRSGREEEAAEALRRAARLGPTDFEIHFTLGSWALSAERTDEALAAFRQALTIQPGQPAATRGAVICLLSRGESGSALELLEQAVDLNPRDLELLNLAIELAHETGDEDRASRWEQQTRALSPDNH